MFAGHPPLDTRAATALIEKVAASGAKQMVFGGGDALQRKDLPQLAKVAKESGLVVEIQTNAQLLNDQRYENLQPLVNLWGLSLDSFERALHDSVRGRVGNYDRVQAAALRFQNTDARWNLRTLISKPTHATVSPIGDWLRAIGFRGIWYLLQYTPLGDEIANRHEFEITDGFFEKVAGEITRSFQHSPFRVSATPETKRRGIYFLIAPDGSVYNHPSPGVAYEIIGNIGYHDFAELEARLQMNYHLHNERYVQIV
jgi:MoaA/NifB/PqqE/SkfB family radical SAM enzyme